MPTVPELNDKYRLSLGLVAALIISTYTVTTFYNNISTIESRMNKRYERQQHQIEVLQQEVKALTQELNEQKLKKATE